jgi:DNA-binding transcriptional ArsR family regulator
MKSAMKDCAANFAMLSDPNRLGILSILSKGPSTVTQLCKSLGLKQPTMSHHLGLLRMGRLVVGTRKGMSIIYTAEKDVLKGMASCLAGLIAKK